jgi:hypothetical protein
MRDVTGTSSWVALCRPLVHLVRPISPAHGFPAISFGIFEISFFLLKPVQQIGGVYPLAQMVTCQRLFPRGGEQHVLAFDLAARDWSFTDG